MSERGFTIIELVICLVLLTGAIGIVGSVILSALEGTTKASSGNASNASVKRMMSAIERDVASTASPGIAANVVRDPQVLSDAVRLYRDAMSSDPTDPGVVDVDDVLIATPTSFRVRADAREQPGVECVTWTAVEAGGALKVVRTVNSGQTALRGPACGAEIASETIISSPVPAGMAGAPAPFSYQLMCGGCGPRPDCTPFTTQSVSADQRRWIVAIDVDIAAISMQGSAVSRTRASSSTSIRARSTSQYRSALRC